MFRPSKRLKYVAYAVMLGCIGVFFVRAFQKNWETVRAHDFHFHAGYLCAAVACVCVSYLIGTRAWQLGLNGMSDTAKLSFSQSVAAVNASSLTKYLPGKVWSYALQVYWLANAGFSKSLVMYVNLISLYISLVSTLIAGLGFLLFCPEVLPMTTVLAALVALVVVDALSLAFHSALFRWAIALINRKLKRELKYFEPTGRLLVEMHVCHLLASAVFGVAAYLMSLGIGYELPLRAAPRLFAAFLISDFVGFAAILVPGGLGVREGFMYIMLGGAANGSLALTLPIATRTLTMGADLLLGAIAFRLLKTFSAPKDAASSE
jgi:glycosyltransferase 2 family protein